MAVDTKATPTGQAAGPLLRTEGIDKRFGAVQALSDVDFEVYGGEVVGLLGDNGAGKSTLIKVIAGVYHKDGGEVFFEGQEADVSTPSKATGLGIATVYQDLALCDNIDVVGNLFLGQEEGYDPPRKWFSWLNESDMEQRSITLLKSLSVKIPSVRTQVAMLSGGQRQSVAIARSLLGEPKLVILDEPTAALGVAQTAQVLDLVRRLRERGLGVVLISHNMEDVFAVCDRAVVLRLGKNAADLDLRESTQEDVVGAITGAEFGEVPDGSGGDSQA